MNNQDLIEYDRLSAIAAATPCGFRKCDGSGHEHNAEQSEWTHQDIAAEFDGGTIEFVSLVNQAGERVEDVLLTARTTSQMTPADLRAEADAYERYPAWLRSMADSLEAAPVRA